jgi:hypothetical protein
MATTSNEKYWLIARTVLGVLGRACLATAWRMGVLFGRTTRRAW